LGDGVAIAKLLPAIILLHGKIMVSAQCSI